MAVARAHQLVLDKLDADVKRYTINHRHAQNRMIQRRRELEAARQREVPFEVRPLCWHAKHYCGACILLLTGPCTFLGRAMPSVDILWLARTLIVLGMTTGRVLTSLFRTTEAYKHMAVGCA